MSLIRFCCLALFLVFAGQAKAQPMPLLNFVDVPVANPTTPERVKAAIVRTALILSYDVVQETDGSLIVSQTKVDDYAFKFKVTYDANKYSLTYLGSTGLRFTDGRYFDSEAKGYVYAVQKHSKLYKDEPETPFARKVSDAYIHPFYETSVRQMFTGVRRYLNSPL